MPTSERAGLVVNVAKVADPHRLRERVEKVLADAGWGSLDYRETTRDDAGCGAAKALLAGGCDLLLVAGGDGTAREVCTAAAGSGVPVVILPLGTGNLLARNLGLPLDLPAALAGAVSGVDRAVDLGRVSGEDLPADGFLVMAGIGFDAAMMSDAPEALKARVGPLAYVVSGLRHLRDPAFRVTLTVDGRASRHRARTVLVGNVGALQAGLQLLPDAVPDDGLLDVVVLAPRRLLDWLLVGWRLLRRDRRTDDRMHRLRGGRVRVAADRRLQRQLDGDPIAPGHGLDISTEPRAVLVRCSR